MPCISRTTAGPDDPIYTEKASFFVAHKNPNKASGAQHPPKEHPEGQMDHSGDSETQEDDEPARKEP